MGVPAVNDNRFAGLLAAGEGGGKLVPGEKVSLPGGERTSGDRFGRVERDHERAHGHQGLVILRPPATVALPPLELQISQPAAALPLPTIEGHQHVLVGKMAHEVISQIGLVFDTMNR